MATVLFSQADIAHLEITMKEIRLRLAKEDQEDISMGKMPLHEVSANEFLTVGIDLEDQQYVGVPCSYIDTHDQQACYSSSSKGQEEYHRGSGIAEQTKRSRAPN